MQQAFRLPRKGQPERFQVCFSPLARFMRIAEARVKDVMDIEKVTPERARNDAVLVIIRLGLGNYELKGPCRNVLETESRVAWATVTNELANEGYALGTVGEYGAICNMSPEEVLSLVWKEGCLFALQYGDEVRVALPGKVPILPEMEGN
jgi:hypothetical protein